MNSKGTRIPFDHLKNIYGANLEHYSYQKIQRSAELSRKAYLTNNRKKYRYEKVREKILEYVTLAFSVFMLGVGVYFILSAIAMAA